MAQFPALPLWTDAYLADTTHLSDAEHGRYLQIIIHMWRAPQCRLPNNNSFLSRKFNRSPEAIEIEIKPIMQEFFKCDGNWWTHKRLVHERKYLEEQSLKQSARAKVRWDKEKGIYRGNATSRISRSDATSGIAPTPTPVKEKKEQVSQNGGYARGRGVPPAGEALADENLEKFMARLAKELDGSSAGKGWAIVGSATDHADPLFGRCLLLCKVTAKKLGKGWPFNWPTDHAIFDRIVTGGLSEEQAPHDQQI